jgi:hypothetical protein
VKHIIFEDTPYDTNELYHASTVTVCRAYVITDVTKRSCIKDWQGVIRRNGDVCVWDAKQALVPRGWRVVCSLPSATHEERKKVLELALLIEGKLS